MKITGQAGRLLCYGSVLIVVLFVYCWPALRARTQLGSDLPAMFAPDLTMYMALSSPSIAGTQEFENPYYHVSVDYQSAGYLRFHLAPGLFSRLRAAFPDRLWACLFVWNFLCWVLLGTLAIFFFDRYVPGRRVGTVILGVVVFMLFNVSSLRPLLSAWAHLPSLAGFETIELPFIRSFIPVMPMTLLLAYLALQIEALRRTDAVSIWVAMAGLQFLALAMFPYTTLMMAGLTAIAVLCSRALFADGRGFPTLVVYGIACGLMDALFAMRGSVGFYNNHSALVHFQPRLLPHLPGGNWFLLGLLVLGVIAGREIQPEVKWPLVGLGGADLILLLGDAIVPARTLLLSHHAGYFVHAASAILFPFALCGVFPRAGMKNRTWFLGTAIAVTVVNGLLMSAGLYRGWLPYNQETFAFARALAGSSKPDASDLVIAPSRTVDDDCGWVSLVSKAPVLYCTDAQVMLSPQQNEQIHRFRQAIYLYLTGADSVALRQALTGPNRLNVMYRLGYWAEASSHSPLEQNQGVQEIEREIVPWLQRVERADPEVGRFFGRFHRIIVIDNVRGPAFAQARLQGLLKSETEREEFPLKISTYVAKQ